MSEINVHHGICSLTTETAVGSWEWYNSATTNNILRIKFNLMQEILLILALLNHTYSDTLSTGTVAILATLMHRLKSIDLFINR